MLYEILIGIIKVFEDIVMQGFFWYSLLLIILRLTDSIKEKFFDIDKKICLVISMLAKVYIVAIVVMCFVLNNFVNVTYVMAAEHMTESKLYFWLSFLAYPVILFIITQIQPIEKLRNLILFRGITATIFILHKVL
jgi:hypothetical protein